MTQELVTQRDYELHHINQTFASGRMRFTLHQGLVPGLLTRRQAGGCAVRRSLCSCMSAGIDHE